MFVYTKIKELIRGDLVQKSSFMALSSAIGAFSRFLLVTILARYLSPESYGVWVSITSIAAIMMFGDLGITNSLRNKLSYLIANEKDTNNEQREYFYTAFYFFFVLAILLALCFCVLLYFDFLPIEKLFNTSDVLLKEKGKNIFIFIQIIFLLGIPFGMVNGLFFSYNESHIAAKISIVNNITSLAGVIFLAFVLKIDIVLLAIIYFSLSFLFNVVSLIWFIWRRRWHTNFSINASLILSRFFELLRSGVMFLGVQLSNSFILNIPTVFLGALADLRIAASYNIIQKLYVFVIAIYQSAFNPVWSKMSLMAGSGKWNEVLVLRKKVVLISLSMIGLAICVFTPFSKWIVHLLVGEGYEVPMDLVFLVGVSFLSYILFESAALIQSALNFVHLRMFLQITIAFTITFLFSFFQAHYGYKSIPVVLSIVWLFLFFILYYEANYYIHKRLKNEESIL